MMLVSGGNAEQKLCTCSCMRGVLCSPVLPAPRLNKPELDTQSLRSTPWLQEQGALQLLAHFCNIEERETESTLRAVRPWGPPSR